MHTRNHGFFVTSRQKKILADFTGGDISSDGGALLLREVDRRLGLLEAVNKVLVDSRDERYVHHSQLSLLCQRIYGICLGYEDLNDHDHLRHDSALQVAVNREGSLASSSTLCRLENQADRASAVALHQVLIEQFIASYSSPPEEIGFDATDDLIHGEQEGRFFNGYYRGYCFLPLYVFCGDHLLVSYLRGSHEDASKHAWAILALLVKRLRQSWPDVKIVFRGDSGFCRHRMLTWCDRHHVICVVGIGKNARLLRLVKEEMAEAEEHFTITGDKVRWFRRLDYAAHTWKQSRQVIAKIEHTAHGSNPRFVVTNHSDAPQTIYDIHYCARGDMENRIKEKQLDMFADRTSCHEWYPNQLRLLFSSLAYTLMAGIRRMALVGTDWANKQVGNIRLKLLKAGAVIVRNSRRIRWLLPTHYPWKSLFSHVVAKLCPD